MMIKRNRQPNIFQKIFSRKYEDKQESIVTIDSLLTEDDVIRIIENLNKEKTHIKHLVIIHVDDDGSINWDCTNTEESKLVWMLETSKQHLMQDDEEE